MSANAILRAIDAEYKAKCQNARAAYEKRMKPARRWVADARAQLARKEAALAAHQAQAAEEEQAAFTEARLWKEEAVRAVKGERPFKISDVPTTQRQIDDPVEGRKTISLPRVSCLDGRP